MAAPARRGLDRRRFLGGAAGLAAAALVWRPVVPGAWAQAVPPIASDPFTLGVGSGDPLPDRVVLWTRLAPEPMQGGGMDAVDVPVDWEVATDAGFADVVASGTAMAPAAYAHSVHVDAAGLSADSWYSYRFRVGEWTSPVGRTRTAPAAGAAVDRLALGFASCQNYGNGYYTAHAHLAAEDLDVVFFLGDYIYESTGSRIRPVPGGETVDLAGYRNRYALYRSDPNLQAAHQRCPWIVTWDDHEVDNNYAGDVSQDDDPAAAFLARRAQAYQAWWEHQAVRMPAPTGPDLVIHRSLEWGSLASFFVLDTRQFRADQACGDGLVEPCDTNLDPTRTMLGPDQEAWLERSMTASCSTWNLVAQQVVMAPTPLGTIINQDQWDGYPVARQRMLDLFARPEVRNPLVLTGDIHASGAGRLVADAADPASPVVAHELVGTSISSSFPAGLDDIFETIVMALPNAVYANASQRGYVTVEVTSAMATARWRVVDTIDEPTSDVATDFTWEIEAQPDPDPARCAPTPETTTTTGPAASPTTTDGRPTGTSATPTAARPVSASPTYAG
jgi:alkaline phosphatase D